ncbi:MAG TPA: potassium channel family protein [bacterium]|nr:potassium channel family protein [bacterium]HPQ65423.1 potassium channel family protein [bacterium]
MIRLALKTRSYLEMLTVLGVMVVLTPLTQSRETPLADFILSFSFLLLLVASLQTVSTRGIKPRSKWVRGGIYGAAGIALILDIGDLIFGRQHTPDMPWLRGLSTACYAVLLGAVCCVIVKDLFSGKKVSVDKIYGAISVYLLIGMFWVCLYSLLCLADPMAITYADGSRVNAYGTIIYFSFTTIATVGYGDIIPRSQIAMTLSNLEAVTGQMFLAVVVARLVGYYIAQSRDQAPDTTN